MSGNAYQNACRLCLTDGATIPIFHATTREYRDLHNKLCTCFGEKIEDKPGYPRNICEICFLKVGDVISFRDQYHQSCKTLEDKLKVVVKHEPEEQVYIYEAGNHNEVTGVKGYEVKLEKTEELNPEVIYDDNINDPNQLVELIKLNPSLTLVNISKSKKDHPKLRQSEIKDTITLEKKKLNKNSETKKTKVSVKTVVKKINAKAISVVKRKSERKKSRKRKSIKNNGNKFGKLSKTQIAACLLEGKYIFKEENWELKPKEELIKKDENNKELEMVKEQKLETKLPPEARLCDLCGDTFSSWDQFRRHILKNHRENDTKKKIHQCHICNKILSSVQALGRHTDSVHGAKDKVCSTCGKTFSLQQSLTKHINHAHLNVPRRHIPRKACEQCGKDFSTAKTLLIHVRSVHTGERPCECSVCGAKFHHEDYLATHMRLHTGERPFKCPVCSQGYAQPCNMKSHIKHNHRISHLTETQLKTIHQRYLRLMEP